MKSGLLENDDIVVSRRANSYVLTAVGKTKLHNLKKANGLEKMLKKAGAGNCLESDKIHQFFTLQFFQTQFTNSFVFFSKFSEGITITPVRRSQNAASDTEKDGDSSFITTSTHFYLIFFYIFWRNFLLSVFNLS